MCDSSPASLTFPEQGTLQPDTPLTLKHQDTTYRLESSSTVQQRFGPAEATVMNSNDFVQTIHESILDLESNQRSRACQVGHFHGPSSSSADRFVQVTCTDAVSDDSWISFLRQCDIFTTPVDLKPGFGNDRDTLGGELDV